MSSYLGIDIGGSSIKFALTSSTGLIEGTFTTVPHAGADVMDVIVHTALEMIAASNEPIAGIGVGSPGYLNHDQTQVLFAANLDWRNFPLVERIATATGRPVFLDGDANLAALAEAHSGAARDTSSSLFVALGTGIGVAQVVNGSVWRGAHGAAGNAGHMPIAGTNTDCACGLKNCWESVASARALGAELKAAGLSFEDALSDAPTATAVVRPWIDSLTNGLVPLVALFDPEVVVLGGAISANAQPLVQHIESEMKSKLLSATHVPTPALRLAQLGGQAGAIGAGLYAAQRLEANS